MAVTKTSAEGRVPYQSGPPLSKDEMSFQYPAFDEDDQVLEEPQERKRRALLIPLLFGVAATLGFHLERAQPSAKFRVERAFYDAHKEAAKIGVELAGGGTLTDSQLHVLAARISAEQQSFWAQFVRDIRQGRYTPRDEGGQAVTKKGGEALLQARIDLYKRRLIGTANQAWLMVLSRDPSMEARWELGIAEHCIECPREAALGWRLLSSFTRVPGDGSTPCLTNCQCTLITRDGKRSFSSEALNVRTQ